jgi:hypothetical protein
MKKLTVILTIIALCFIALPSMAQDTPAPTPEWIDMGYGSYAIHGNFMIWKINGPVMTDRFSRYGYPERDRSNNIVINTTAEAKAKENARALREKLLALRDRFGLYALSSVTLQYQNQIRIERRGDTSWDILKDDIIPLFNETYGKPAE